MKVKRLEWDSTFFGFPVGRVDVSDRDHFNEFDFLIEARGFALVYLFSRKTLDSNALILVDTKIVFEKAQLVSLFVPSEVSCYRKEVHSMPQLEELALTSGEESRFKTDRRFSLPVFQRLYKRWLVESLERKFAFETLVYVDRGDTVGFITIGKKDVQTATIGLIAVSPQRRGKGVGRTLIEAAENLAYSKGYTAMHVATQLRNRLAYSFYLRNGYTENSRTNVYHYWSL